MKPASKDQKLETYRSGAVLFRHGDASRFAYRIIRGEAEVLHETAEGPRVIGTARAGEFVGEIGALVGCARNGSVRFVVESEVERFERRDLIKLLSGDHNLGRRMLHALSLRTRVLVDRCAEIEQQRMTQPIKTLSFRAQPFVRRILRRIIDALRAPVKRFSTLQSSSSDPRLKIETFVMAFNRGDILFKEGELSREVYRIKRGKVVCTKKLGDVDHRIGTLRSGDFLGEMGVLESRLRNATARAASPLVVEVIPPQDFFNLMIVSKKDYYRVVDALCERAHRLTEQLGDDPLVGVIPGASPLDQVMGSFESLTELAGDRVVSDLRRFRRFLGVQKDHGFEMVTVYQRFLRGEASQDELERANSHFRDYLKIAGLGTLAILPGAPITIPLAVKLGKVVGVDILPSAADLEEPPRDESALKPK